MPTERLLRTETTDATQTDLIETCLDDCLETHETSIELGPYLLDVAPDATDPGFVALLNDLAQASQTAADFLLRGSPLADAACRACAAVAAAVLEAGADIDDEEVHEYLAVVGSCIESCRRVAPDPV